MIVSKKAFHDFLVSLMHVERRTEPFWRYRADALLRAPVADLLQALINLQRSDQGLALAQERELPDERELLDSIISDMATDMRQKYAPGRFERAGNTKTHGIVRAELTIANDLPAPMRRGLFAEPKSYRAWVRFSGPGPDSPADIDDVGFLSMSIKVMGVPGPKLSEDERYTQDFLGICTPTFVTPDVRANAQLQRQSCITKTPLYYFLNRTRPHLLDFLMQSLWNETQTSPLECQYYSCVPYLLGEGQAMQYSMRTRLQTRSRVARLPLRPPDNYLRENMAATLRRSDVEFDLLLQLQTDPHRMPIENAAVLWPERLSPRVPAAVLRIPRQQFDSPAQLRFGSSLSFTPWHCLPEHRPLGNQSRARRRMYAELSRLRQSMNKTPHYEPTGDEVFDASSAPRAVSRPARVLAD